jgi:hypothetical protein
VHNYIISSPDINSLLFIFCVSNNLKSPLFSYPKDKIQAISVRQRTKLKINIFFFA